MKVVRFESSGDDLTSAFHDALDRALPTIRGAAPLVVLAGADATRDQLNALIDLNSPIGLFAGMSHGGERDFVASPPAPAPILGSLARTWAINDSIIHLLSCNCARELGADLVANQNARAFIGYRDFVAGPIDLALSDYYVAETVAIDLAIAAGSDAATTRQAGLTALRVAYAKMENDRRATCFDLAALAANHSALVGPWSPSTEFGGF